MKLFLDTSSLVKLYHEEAGSLELKQLLSANNIEQICLSELTQIELPAAIWKKVRTNELSEGQALQVIELITKDFEKFVFIDIETTVKRLSIELIAKYGISGLRTLDAIQLASAVYAHQLAIANTFQTADTKLLSFMKSEGILQ